LTEISEINNLFGSGTCGTNLCSTRAERSTFLALSKPSNWTTIAEDNTTIHTSKFEKRQKGALRHCLVDLRTPTGIAIGGDSGSSQGRRRRSVRISLDISQRMMMDIRMHWSHGLGREGNAIVLGRMNVV
jgi:hypothetical protein